MSTKNDGMPWILGSNNREETEKANGVGKTECDAGDEAMSSFTTVWGMSRSVNHLIGRQVDSS